MKDFVTSKLYYVGDVYFFHLFRVPSKIRKHPKVLLVLTQAGPSIGIRGRFVTF